MKTTFTKGFILKNKGCYSKQQVLKLSFINNETITIYDISPFFNFSKLIYSRDPKLNLPTFDLPKRMFTFDQLMKSYEIGKHYQLTSESNITDFLESISEIEDAEVEIDNDEYVIPFGKNFTHREINPNYGRIKLTDNKITITKVIYKKA